MNLNALLVVGLLVVGCWLLVVGCWLFQSVHSVCVCPQHERMQQSLRLIGLITCVMSPYSFYTNVTESPKRTQTTTCATGSSNQVSALQLQNRNFQH